MSLNCLTCQVLRRTDSDNDRHCHVKDKDLSRKFCCISIERSWSGNISPVAYEQIRNESMPIVPSKKIKMGHRRVNTIDTTYGAEALIEGVDGAGPRLVRSSGMRRDWSFEDLRAQRDGKMRKEMRIR